jgi:predicted nucleotidyltransferase component of viral defense system
MGKIKTGFTSLQETVFQEFSKREDLKQFYFTGGTALSVFYLNHRFSEDLDFFSETDFDNGSVIDFIKQSAEKLHLEFRFTQRYKARIFEFVKDGKLMLKTDFVHYPYKRIEKGKTVNGVEIDSLRDIATNKLLTINQRSEIKDFVDLYFLLKKYTIWDLIYSVEAKFGMEMDMVLIGADFMKVEMFDYLPKMIKNLTLKGLKEFYNKQAENIGKRISK